MSVNRVILVGRLGQDAELRHLESGTSVCNFTVATSEQWKDKQGNKQERTEWHKCNAWQKLAEICGQYLKKGSLVYIEGKLETRSYEKDGEKRYSTEIRVENMRMLGGKKDGEQRNERPASRQDTGGYVDDGGYGSAPANHGGMDDDIPF